MRLDQLSTPSLVLDRRRLLRNIRTMSERAQRAGIDLRPHLKTAKSARVAELATAGHSGGITVSTLAEAEYFFAHGFVDITCAVCMVPDKLERAAALAARGARLTVLTDHGDAARALASRAAVLDARLAVLVEIDSGEHRTGLAWDSDDLLATARVLNESRQLRFAGVLTHAGQSYGCKSVAEIVRVAELERRAVVDAAARLRDAGLSCDRISAGSTPTAVHAQSFDGLTEIRPGVYSFFDLTQATLQSCTVDDIAISVVATVISHHPEHGRLIIDAGGLALSKDLSAAGLLPDTGYGWICDLATCERINDLHVAIADQEHGYVTGRDIPYDRLPIGSRVRVLPNHACMTAAAYNRYAVIDGGEGPLEIIEWWNRVNGW